MNEPASFNENEIGGADIVLGATRWALCARRINRDGWDLGTVSEAQSIGGALCLMCCLLGLV